MVWSIYAFLCFPAGGHEIQQLGRDGGPGGRLIWKENHVRFHRAPLEKISTNNIDRLNQMNTNLSCEEYIPWIYMSFGFCALGSRVMSCILNTIPCGIMIDGFCSNCFISNYFRTKGWCVHSILAPGFDSVQGSCFTYKNLRDFNLRVHKEEKKKLKQQTLFLNWPDTSGLDMQLVQQFKPDYLVILFNDFTGSTTLKDFLRDKSDWLSPRDEVKYKLIYQIERRCGALDGSEIKVELLILMKSGLCGPHPIRESCKPILLFF